MGRTWSARLSSNIKDEQQMLRRVTRNVIKVWRGSFQYRFAGFARSRGISQYMYLFIISDPLEVLVWSWCCDSEFRLSPASRSFARRVARRLLHNFYKEV